MIIDKFYEAIKENTEDLVHLAKTIAIHFATASPEKAAVLADIIDNAHCDSQILQVVHQQLSEILRDPSKGQSQ